MKKTVRDGYRLEITYSSRWLTENPQHLNHIQAFKRLEKSVRRHLDDDDYDSIEIKWNTREVCEFCGEDWELWEDGEDKGLPACCERAQVEFMANKEKADD